MQEGNIKVKLSKTHNPSAAKPVYHKPKQIHSAATEKSKKSRIRKKMLIFIGALIIIILAVGYNFIAKPKIIKKNYEEGVKNLAEGKFDQAADNFEKAAQGGEFDQEALYKLAVSQYNKKEYEAAIGNYSKVIENDPLNAAAYNGLANIYRDKKDYDKATEQYKKATERNSNYIVAYTNWAIMLMDNGKVEEAKRVAEEGLKNNPQSSDLKNLQKVIEDMSAAFTKQ